MLRYMKFRHTWFYVIVPVLLSMFAALFSPQLMTDMNQGLFALYIGAIALVICTPLAIAVTLFSTLMDHTIEFAKRAMHLKAH